MTTITKEGHKVGILRSIGEAVKIGGTRVSAKTACAAGLLLLPAAVVTKTAIEAVPYVVNRVIDNTVRYATLGYDQAKPFVENLKPMGSTTLEGLVAGLTGLAITGGIVYGALKLYRGGQNIGQQAKTEAAQAYQEGESRRQIDNQVRVAGYNADAQVQIHKINEKAKKRTGAIQ